MGHVVTSLGLVQPILVDGHGADALSPHEDGGTSRAETAIELAEGTGPDVARDVVETVAQAAFARGNHRVAWSVLDADTVTITALEAAGFIHEGRAAPPPNEDTSWQLWSRLTVDPAV